MDSILTDDITTLQHLPDKLLNKDNKALKRQIVEYEEEADMRQKELEQNAQRVSEMDEHLKNVKQEINNTQQLNEAKKREIETEFHMTQLAERDVGRITQEINMVKNGKQEIQEKMDAIQNNVFRANLQMDVLKVEMNFNQDELEQWDLARKQKEDDVLALEKYHRIDDAKTKELNLQLEKLTKAVAQQKKELEREITETQAAQIELDKTSEDFKNVHRERQNLIKQWEEAVQAMHKRDDMIKSAGSRFAEGRAWQVKRTEQLQDRSTFLNIEIQNNKEMENKVQQEERVLAKYRNDHFLISQHLKELDDELEVLKNTLSKATQDLNAKKTKKTNYLNNLKDKQEDFDNVQQLSLKTTERLQKEIESASDLEKQNKLVADMLSDTEGRLIKMEKDMGALKEEQYQKAQELFKVRTEEANLMSAIRAVQSKNKNMQDKIKALDQDTFKQQELLYNIEFQVQQMERKVNRAKGERTEEEKKELKEKIGMLHTMLDDLQKQYKVLDLQVKRVMDDVRQQKLAVDTKISGKDKSSSVILELTLENNSCQNELEKLKKEKESLMVNHDVLKLQVNRMTEALEQRSKQLLGYENRKQQLSITVEEREAQIKNHMEVLRMELKTAEEERRRIGSELRERQNSVQHLKNKFQVLVNRMQRDEDDVEAEMTHAQYIVRTAKEREELQAKGDALDAEIRKMEQDSLKLDKTLETLKLCNSTFAAQYKRATEGDPETQTKKILMQHNREVQLTVNKRTNDMKQVLKNEMTKMSEYQEVMRDEQELRHKINILNEGMDGIRKNIGDCQGLISRLGAVIQNARRKSAPEIVEDIELQEFKEKYQHCLTALVNYSQNHSDSSFRDRVFRVLADSNIDIPRTQSPRQPSESGSRTESP